MVTRSEGIFTQLGDYQIVKFLGDGQTCKVKLGKHLKTGEYHALKILKGKYGISDEGTQKEIEILSQLRHPNLIQLLGYFKDAKQVKPSGKVSQKTFLSLEIAHGEDLYDWVSETGPFEDELCRYYFGQILDGLEYCHKSGYCHRDMKPANILLSQDFQIKLADFGFSSLIEGNRGQDKLFTIVGTQGYMAPELVEHKPYNGEIVDLFAAAVILFVMRSQQPPWMDANRKKDPYYKMFIQKPSKFWKFNCKSKKDPNYYCKEFIDLVDRMFQLDPKNRLNLQQLKNHPYMKGNIYTKEQVQQQLSLRKNAYFGKQMDQQVPLNISQAYQGVNKFRDIQTGVLVDLDLAEEFENLSTNFPTIKEKRLEYEYDQTTLGLNSHFVKATIDDTFQFLLCVLMHDKKGTDIIEINDENYVITATFLNKATKFSMDKKNTYQIIICITFFKQGEDACVVEFRKISGNRQVYQEKTKSLKQKFLDILSASNNQEQQQQQQSKDQQEEETKEDDEQDKEAEETKEDEEQDKEVEETKQDEGDDKEEEEVKTDD